MFTVLIILFFLYVVLMYNELMVLKKQIEMAAKIIEKEKQSENQNMKKLQGSLDFYNKSVEKFNNKLDIFPTNIIARIFKILPIKTIK